MEEIFGDLVMMECPACEGNGNMWDVDDWCGDECPHCQGEGEVDQTLGEEIIEGLQEYLGENKDSGD